MRRWLFFAALLIGSALLLVLLPAPYASLAFIALVIGALVFALRRGGAAERSRWGREVAAQFREARDLWRRISGTPGFFRRVSALLAAAFMLLSAHALRPGSLNSAGQGLIYAVIGALLLGLALWRGRRLHLAEIEGSIEYSKEVRLPDRAALASSAPALLLGLLALLAVTLINIVNVDTPLLGWLWYASPGLQFVLFVGATGLLVWGWGARVSLPLAEAAPLALVVLLAFVLRVWNLEYSVHRYVDEVHYVNGVIGLWHEPTVKILTPFGPITSFTWIYPALQSLMVDLLGPGLAALRIISAITGTLTAAALYGLARALFNRETALLAALFLATFPPHIHFSRLGLNNIADPLFGTLAFALAAQALRTNSRACWALAGIALGMTQYFYEGGRLLYPPLMLAWLALIWLLRPQPAAVGRGQLARGMLFMGLWASLMAAPVYLTLLARGVSLTPRLDLMAADGDLAGILGDLPYRTFLETVRDPFWMLAQLPDSGWFYGGEGGLIPHALLPVFLLGAAWMLWRWRAGGLLLILWIAAAGLGNSLLRNNTDAARFVVLLPALPLVMALGLRETWRLVAGYEAARSAAGGRLRSATLAALVAALAWGQIAYYYNEHLPAFNARFTGTLSIDDALFRAVRLPAGTEVYLISSLVIWQPNIASTVLFFRREADLTIQFYTPEEFAQGVASRLPRSRSYAFLVEPRDVETGRLLRERFNIGVAQVSPYDLPAEQQFLLYYAPARRG